ncbi:hypothetical protein HZA42_03990 [Candidatus Peregrinibacteria bacterium]|nr:hypothetical protein [Candidatus Peregrinibacteria bacterium]
METGIEKPQVLYIPVSPGFPDQEFMRFVRERVQEGALHAVVLETYMSGGLPSQSPFDELNFAYDIARRVPTFLVPQADRQQKYPRTSSEAENEHGAVALETAYSGIAGQVVTRIQEALRRSQDHATVIAEVREHFRQKQWPPPMTKCGECGE